MKMLGHVRQCLPVLIPLFALVLPLAAQSRLSIEVRGGDGQPLKGYLLIRDTPPNLDLGDLGRVLEVRDSYYRYFNSFEERMYGLRGSSSVLLEAGSLSIAPDEIRDSDGKPWSHGRLALLFFFWSDDPKALVSSGSLADKIGRCQHVTWWSVYLGKKEAAASREVHQIVTVRNTGRWTESYNFPGNSSGGGYFPLLQEHQSFVLEPPLDWAGKVMIATKDRPPVLLVHGINGTAREWDDEAEFPIPYELRESNYPLWELYYGLGQESLVDSGAMLYEAVQQVRQANPAATRVDMTTHSYGGVVARQMLHAFPDSRLHLRRLLMVSPPHHGSYSAFRVARGDIEEDRLVLRQRMGFTGDMYQDPNAPIYRDLSPGSAALLELESSPDAFSLFKSGDDPEARAFVLTGDKTDWSAALFHDEAPDHDDGVVSISSASLLDLGVPLATISLTHREEPKSPEIVKAIRSVLEGADNLRSLDGVIFDTPCPGPPRGGLTVNAKGFSGCPSGVAEVRLNYKGANITYETKLTRNLKHDSFFLYDSDRSNAAYRYEPPGLAPKPVTPGLAFPLDSLDSTPATLFVACTDGSVELSYPVQLRGCRTNTIRLDRILAPAPRKFTVVKTGEGTVKSTPVGIDCGENCSAEFTDDVVTLTATPAGSFTGWGGACKGTDPVCRLDPSISATITATFAATVPISTIADLGGGVAMRFVQIQPGEFTMGCSTGDSECAPWDSPRHRVQITKSFQMGKSEVTQAQWQAIMGSSLSYFKGADLPMERVSWNDIQQFLTRLNGRNDGYRYRLPTEAEWEYAARAGSTDKYAGGVLAEIAWYTLNSSSKTHPVGEKKPNAWGLHDMLGNVWEWVQDWWGFYSSSPATDPPGPSSGVSKVLRGGSMSVGAGELRVSFHFGNGPDSRDSDIGFRCVREPSTAATTALNALTLSASSVVGGNAVTGTVTLTASAPPGSAVVALTSDNTNATVPVSVTVSPGTTSAQFTVTTTAVTATRTAVITAKLGNDTKTAQLTVTAAGGGIADPFGMAFVTIPAGEFMMGCSPGDRDCQSDEKPLHKVQITKSFELGKFEVTQAQWQAVMGSNPSFFQGSDRPVERVSWNSIQTFLARLNTRNDGYHYRLPTEAEWEYAARAGSTGPFYGTLAAVAWSDNNSGSQTHPVGQKAPNSWGLYDMLGNVWEWCQDWYDGSYYSRSPVADPPGAPSGSRKVLRGFSWYYEFSWLWRVSVRGYVEPGFGNFDVGFRCVRGK